MGGGASNNCKVVTRLQQFVVRLALQPPQAPVPRKHMLMAGVAFICHAQWPK